MSGYITWTIAGIVMCATRKEAEERAEKGNPVVKVDASDHVHNLAKPVVFTQEDQSYPELEAALMNAE